MSRDRDSGRSAHAFSGHECIWLPTAQESIDFDARSHALIPERAMMENAGRAAAIVLHRMHPRGRIVGFAGSGHNGGDLVIMMRTLRTWGRDVTIIRASQRGIDSTLLQNIDVPVYDFDSYSDWIGADIIVDGILGTGARGAPRGTAATAIDFINRAHRAVVALDLPSGIDATSGVIHDRAVRADVTITFGWPKLGMLFDPARSHCGRIISVDIGFPEATSSEFAAQVITPGWTAARLPQRGWNAHKGNSGTLLIVAGSRGMAGAAVITGRAAVHTGTGIVRIASDESNRTILQGALPEALFHDRTALNGDVIRSASAILCGPGLGRDPDASTALDIVLKHGAGIPTILDADALSLLAQNKDALKAAAADRPLLITPHPKEMSRVLGTELAKVTEDRINVARESAREFGCEVLLKGAPSVVADLNEPLLVSGITTSDVAVGGMGDQLAGVIGGFAAAGLDLRTAAGLGLHCSGRAAILAGRGRALSPTEVTAHLGDAFADPGAADSDLNLPFVTFDQPPPV